MDAKKKNLKNRVNANVHKPLTSNSMAASCLPNEFSATHTYRPESEELTFVMINFDLTDVSVYISSTLYLLEILISC